jgi:hypothetical protein
MALPQISFSGPAVLAAATQVQPRVTLLVYDHAVILRKETGNGGMAEYPVDPSQIAQALAAKATFSTGFLSRNTLFVGESGLRRKVIEYRPAQLTGIWLEGAENPLRVPLPPLVMVRTTIGDQNAQYQVYAVRGRPASGRVRLYVAPLPHVSGGVCWGSVAKPGAEALSGISLAEDWRQFLGSRFGNHTVQGKSKTRDKDIRQMYYDLVGKDAYPLHDLIPANRKLDDLMKVD